MFDTRDVMRVYLILSLYVTVLSLGLAAQAWFRPDLGVTWLVTWVLAVVAPAGAAAIGARRLRGRPLDSRMAIRLLVAPMAVSAVMIVTLVQVVVELGRR